MPQLFLHLGNPITLGLFFARPALVSQRHSLKEPRLDPLNYKSWR